MKERKITYVEMTEKTVQETAAKAFRILKFLFEVLPPRFSGGDDCGEITIKCHPDGSISDIIGRVRPASEDDVKVVYKVLHDGKIYKIELWDSEDTYGYMSCSPKWDPYTYVFCNFKEERSDGTKRCEMDFAFNIEKRTFVELFSIEYFNKSDLIRICEQIEHFEKMFLDKEII
jgi:hypothetical protein